MRHKGTKTLEESHIERLSVKAIYPYFTTEEGKGKG